MQEAGPTGLVLALCLAQYNLPFRIIDKESGPGSSSRAIAVQARSLEYCRQLGIAEDVIKIGMKVNTGHIRQHNRRKAVFPLGNLGEGISPFPYVLSYPQDEHEQLLVEKLEEKGIAIEWNTKLVSVEETRNRLRSASKRGKYGTCRNLFCVWV